MSAITLFLAATLLFPALPPSEYGDTEVVTNVALPAVRAGKQLLREQPRDAGVLVRCKCNAFVCHGFAISANHFAHRHDEAHLALAVRQPCQRSVTVLVCCDIIGLAFWATCIWRLQIKAQNAIFAFQPKFAL